jgi:hypothetical protein
MDSGARCRGAVRWLDQQTEWSWLDFTMDGARAVLSSLSSSMLTFVVFALVLALAQFHRLHKSEPKLNRILNLSRISELRTSLLFIKRTEQRA